MRTLLDDSPFIPKELSWLAFNHRVLQEACRSQVPLLERLRFLGIASSNLDEFFRVRVAGLKRMSRLGSKAARLIGHDPESVLERVRQGVLEFNEEYDRAFSQVLEELAMAGVRLVAPEELAADQQDVIRTYFRKHVRAALSPALIGRRGRLTDLDERRVHLAVQLVEAKGGRVRHGIIDVPISLPRFHVLPAKGRTRQVVLLDDIIRSMLPEVFALFRPSSAKAWAFKITRDAELDLDDDLVFSYSAKLAASLKRRAHGATVRLLYDADMPPELLALLVSKLGIRRKDTLLPGGRIHKRSDFMAFPDLGLASHSYPRLAAIPHAHLPADSSLFASLRERDVLLHVPYNPFSQFIDLLREAALDPKVTALRMTLYRVARSSDVVRALVAARRNGKQVTVVVELQARFNEEDNIRWAERMRDEGVDVVFGVPGLKVHSKLLLVERIENRSRRYYAGIGTGNFNEDTAAVFEDMLLLTADPRITGEVAQLFAYFRKTYLQLRFEHLLVSPWTTRERIERMIKAESSRATHGHAARLDIKVNNLADHRIIEKLYTAAESGVELRLNVRGMFALRNSWPRKGAPVQSMAIIDRFLEHSRIIRAQGAKGSQVYIGSGDILGRNLDRRVETFVPIFDQEIASYIGKVLDLHWEDQASARVLDDGLSNILRSGKGTRVQQEIARLNQELHRNTRGGGHA